jgi:flagellar biosynthesis chaperone FliJ
MKAFSFRLETLLHLREMAKDKAVAEYGLSISRRENAEKALKERYLEIGKFATGDWPQTKYWFFR